MARWPQLVVILAAGWTVVQSGSADMTQAVFGKLTSPTKTASSRVSLWTPGHLDELHDALLQGRPLSAQLTALGPTPHAGGTHKLSLWVPRGQKHQAVAAANKWQDNWSDRSAVVVREAALDDDDGDREADQDEDGVALSPSWLRGAVGARTLLDGAHNGLAQDYVRSKRAASPDPNEASSEDASVAASSSKFVPPTTSPPPAAQAKAARSHQFVTGRNEKEPPPVVREVEQSQPEAKPNARIKPPPTHVAPVAAGSSRHGAARDALGRDTIGRDTLGRDALGRDALGLRTNEIYQGPGFSHSYELETQRHAADHRLYQADSYGHHSAHAASFGGGYGSSASAASAYPTAAYPPAAYPPAAYRPQQHSRNAPTATPRRIIYYASLPDPAPAAAQLPAQLPGASRVPHEYRGPPYDINGAYSSDARYPPPTGPAQGPDPNLYRYTIIDAEPPGPLLSGYRSHPLSYRDRLPAASPAPAAFPQPYRLNSPLPTSPPALTTDAGPQAASPIQYTQYDYNGIGARTASSSALLDSKQGVVQGLPPGVPLSDDPYRGFNPRQPAPWSMQVGTRLTVKDDGYGSSNSGGPLPPAARRFYVTSQQQPVEHAYAPAYAQARYPRPLDRGNPSALQISEARNRLFR